MFSGKHDNSVIGVANKDYPAAAIANEVMQRMIERGVVKKDQIVTIYKSKTFPTTGYGMVYNLKPELAAKVKEAFFTFPWDGSELQTEFGKTTPPSEIPADQLQGALGGRAQDRPGDGRQIRLQGLMDSGTGRCCASRG